MKLAGSSVVLLSGGLDSAVVLAQTLKERKTVIPLFIDYGQKNVVRERQTYERIVAYYLTHVRKDRYGRTERIKPKSCRLVLPNLNSELTDWTREISKAGVPGAGYVPCRNAMFLSIAFALAESEGCSDVRIGTTWTARDATGTPDATEGFLKSFELTMLLGSRAGFLGNGIKLITPLSELRKCAVIELGLKLKVPFELTWSCFRDGTDQGAYDPCGKCPPCVERREGFKANGVKDPLVARPKKG